MMQDMVDRFLSWKLPKDFNPDGGISFNPTDFQKANDYAWPTGTNLFTAAQAEDMVGFIGAKVIAGAIMAKNEWTSFKPYLKDGETPIMRLEREIADCQAVLSLLKAEKEKTQAAVAAALEKAEAVAYSECAKTRHVTLGKAASDAIRAIPRDSSALDEYKEDIKRLLDAIGVIPESARVCLQSAGYKGLVDWRRLNAVLEQPMTDKEITEWLRISRTTLLSWRKFRGFPEFPTRQNVQDWYGQGNGKNRRAA